MAFEEFTGELDKPTGFVEFTGNLDAESPTASEGRSATPMGRPDPRLVTERVPERSFTDAAKDAGITLLKGAIGLPEAFVGLVDIPTQGRIGKFLEAQGYRPREAKEILDSYLSEAQQAANRKVQQAEGFVPTIEAALDNPSTIASAVGESLPQMLGGVGVARGLLQAAPKVAPLVAGAVGEGAIGAGSAASQIRGNTSDGLLTPKQSAAALAAGIGTAALGVAGGKVAQRFGFDDIETMLAKGSSVGSAKSIPDFAKRVAASGFSEGVLEEMPQSAQEKMWENYALDKPLTDGVGNAAAMGLLTGAAMGAAGGGGGAASALFQTPQRQAARELSDLPDVEATAAQVQTVNFIQPGSASDQAGLTPIVVPDVRAARSISEQAGAMNDLAQPDQDLPAPSVERAPSIAQLDPPTPEATSEQAGAVDALPAVPTALGDANRAPAPASATSPAPDFEGKQAPDAPASTIGQPAAETTAQNPILAPNGKPFSTAAMARLYAAQQRLGGYEPTQTQGGWQLAPVQPSRLGKAIENPQALDAQQEAAMVQRLAAPLQASELEAAEPVAAAMPAAPQATPAQAQPAPALPSQTAAEQAAPVRSAKPDMAPPAGQGTGESAESRFTPEGAVFTVQGSRRSQEGFRTAGDARMSIEKISRIRPDLDFKVEQKPNGLYMLAGYTRQSQAQGADAVPGQTLDSGQAQTVGLQSEVGQAQPSSRAAITPEPAPIAVAADSQRLEDRTTAPRESAYQGYGRAEVPRVQAARRISTILDKLDAGTLTPQEFELQIRLVSEKLASVSAAKNTNKGFGKRERGADIVREKLIAARRRGEVDPATTDFALWAIDQNPAIASGLAISVRNSPQGRAGVAGDYNPAAEVMRVFKGQANEQTAVHEILHHTERMMPEAVQAGIRKEWSRSYAGALAQADPKQRAALERMLPAMAGDRAALADINAAFNDRTLSRDEHYQLINPSEFWAVNAAQILHKRHEAGTWTAKAKQWLGEMLQKVKGLVGLQSDAPVLRGLQAVLEGTGERQSKRMLADEGAFESLGTQADGGESAPSGNRSSDMTPARLVVATTAQSAEALPDASPADGAQDQQMVQDDGSIRPGQAAQPGFDADTKAPKSISLPKWTEANELRANLQDRFLRVQQLQQAIMKSFGQEIGEVSDVYLAEELSYGRAQARIDLFKAEAVQPLLDSLHVGKLSLDELALYAYAKHAPERNAYLQRQGVKDGAGMSDREAEQIIAAFTDAGKVQALAETHRQLMAINKATRDLQLEEGLITQGQYKAWSRMFKNYVPLKGMAAKDVDPIANATVDGGASAVARQGWEVSGDQTLAALGRRSMASQIIEQSIANYARAAQLAVKNSIGKALVSLADAYPDEKVWAFVQEPGANTFTVKMQGQDVHLAIRDEQLLKALRQEGGEIDNEQLAAVVDALGVWTRFSGQILTRYNPVFGAANAVRDSQWAGTVALAELGAEGAARYAAHYLNLKQSGKAWEEFVASGALTGGFHMQDANKVGEELQALLKWSSGAGVQAAKTFEAVRQSLEWLGQRGENQARFALYKAGRDMGLSPAKAASLSKKPMNFNRKGNWARTMGALWMFFNAGAQGAHSLARLTGNPRFQGFVAGSTALTIAAVFANVAMGGDDDDGIALWDKIPDYEKQNNLIIMLPPGLDAAWVNRYTGVTQFERVGRYIKIPLPHPLRIISSAGIATADALRHAQDRRQGASVAQGAANVVGAMFNAVNPLGGSMDVSDTAEVLVGLLPTAASQAYQLHAGRDGFGRKTSSDSRRSEGLPDSEAVSTAKYGGTAHHIARWMNSATGGNQARPGSIDVAPGTLEHAASIATGGVGKFALGAVDFAAGLLGGDPLPAHKTVMAKTFYGQVDRQSEPARFYKLKDEIDALKQIERVSQKNGIEQAWTPQERALLALGNATGNVSRQMAKINSEIRYTMDDAKLTDKEKSLRRQQLLNSRAVLADDFMRSAETQLRGGPR